MKANAFRLLTPLGAELGCSQDCVASYRTETSKTGAAPGCLAGALC